MKRFFAYWFLRFDYGCHMVDAYLAELQGDGPKKAWCENQAHAVKGRIDWLLVQR